MSNESARQVAIEAKHARPHLDHVSLRADASTAFADAFERRLCVVCAPAGYGKTTMTAAALDQCGKQAAWYKLDILDHDPLVFLASVIRAIQRRHPDFGAALLREIEAAPIVEQSVEVLAAQFCSECDTVITADFHLVLDDYHEAMDSAAMNGVLGYIVENCPATLHFLVLTRYEPAFRLEKLNLAGEVGRLQRDLFLLDARQVADVLAHRSGRSQDPDDVARLLELTEGWAASVVLAGMALAWLDVASLSEVLSDPRMRGDVFSYLAEQVFQRQADDVRRFLLATCCLEHVTAELAEALTGSGRSARHLAFLARNHIFTFDTERTGAYRYHNLLRDFLRQRFMQEEGESEFRALQRKTAAALEDFGDRPGAVELLLTANELDLALSVISRGGEALLERRPSEQLRIWAERLSRSAAAGHPWALITHAVVLARDSHFSDALLCLEKASTELERSGDVGDVYQALSIIEWAQFWSGDCPASMATCNRALQLALTDAERLHTLLSLLSSALDMRKWDEVAAASMQADRLLPGASSEERARAQALRAHAAYYRGDMKRARMLIQECEHHHETASQRAAAWNTSGMIELALGQYASAQSRFEMATQAAEAYGQIVTLSMIEDNVALLNASVGEFAAAQQILASLAADSGSLGPTVACFVQTHAGTVFRRAGAIRDSLEPSGRAADAIPEGRDPYLFLNARANLAFTEGLAGMSRGGILRRVSERAKNAGVQFVELKAALFAAILSALAGRDREAVIMFRECIPRQIELGHVNLLAQELGPRPRVAALILRDSSRHLMGPQLLSAISQHWDFANNVRELREETPRDVGRWVLQMLETRTGAAACPSPVDTVSLNRRKSPRSSALDELTPRELVVLRLMAASRSNAEIAQELVVAVSTVKTHVNHILSKLHQSKRIGAVLEYQRLMRMGGENNPAEEANAASPPRTIGANPPQV